MAKYTYSYNFYTGLQDKVNKGLIDDNNKGYFPTVAALLAAYPTGQPGWYALIGETDTFWVWDDDTNQWINSGVAPSPAYINPGVNNVAVGGLPANSGPFNTTVQTMLDRILYPFQQQTTVLTTNPSHTVIREKGVNGAPVVLTATTTRSMNPTYPIVTTVFKRGGSIINTQSGDITPATYTDNTAMTDTTTFSVEVTNSNGYTSTNSKTITFVYPMYGGNSVANDYLNWDTLDDVEAVLTQKRVAIQSNQAITDTFTNRRNIFMYPASYPALVSIIDNNGFETISNYDVFTKNIITRDGVSTLYRVYQLKNDTSQTNFTNTYKFS